MNYEEEKKRYVSFCGSYGHTCHLHTGRIRKTFQSAQDVLEGYGFNLLLEGRADRENLKAGLRILAESGICSACKAEMAKTPSEDRCQIRQCCSAKGFELCSECTDSPCDMLKNNPGVIEFGCIENLEQVQAEGLKARVHKQLAEFMREGRQPSSAGCC
jgi:hypothetical protein